MLNATNKQKSLLSEGERGGSKHEGKKQIFKLKKAAAILFDYFLIWLISTVDNVFEYLIHLMFK